ncbi:hypothetical protein M378DRAFT_172096 [Amanita muscaria Koide BX008]|uniref:Uncharacterized protein n=1 Tax=Amanita muscaria (strain Koide BX008) TaxID=946122 RepID=A0A0C2SSZ4_AMAMK|nr:hypothetical protein M378DRAFT_172096 [Amanita muscaria Koide BX008]
MYAQALLTFTPTMFLNVCAGTSNLHSQLYSCVHLSTDRQKFWLTYVPPILSQKTMMSRDHFYIVTQE